MVTASFRNLPHVTANPERHSSRLVENVRDPSGSGSAGIMTRVWRVGMKRCHFSDMVRYKMPVTHHTSYGQPMNSSGLALINMPERAPK